MAEIWKRKPGPETLKAFKGPSMHDHLDIKILDAGDNYIRGSMPVDHRTQQPFGVLHGGASAVLAETLASIGANHCVDWETHYCVGMELNANHLRPVRSGRVIGTATAIHIGRTTQVWDIKIHDERERLICVSRLTLAVLRR